MQHGCRTHEPSSANLGLRHQYGGGASRSGQMKVCAAAKSQMRLHFAATLVVRSSSTQQRCELEPLHEGAGSNATRRSVYTQQAVDLHEAAW